MSTSYVWIDVSIHSDIYMYIYMNSYGHTLQKSVQLSQKVYLKIINAYISESVMYECDYVREWFDVHSYIHEFMYPTQGRNRNSAQVCTECCVCMRG